MRQAIERLGNIVEAMVADGDLHDLEIEFLKAWLAENPELAMVWPGSAVSSAIESFLADGHISEDERAYLLATLRQMAEGDFASGQRDGQAELAGLCDDTVEIELRDALVCLAGEFLHGTKAACERLLERAGGWPAATLGPHVRYLVIGSRLAADWQASSCGQAIQDARALQQAGHPIAIVTERRWLDSLPRTTAATP